jgi:pimeloyl-ACP methyl ester carboxylesterase
MTTSTGARIEIAGPAGTVSALVWDGPEGTTPVLFLHPVNTGAVVWTAVAEELGRPAAAVDYRGHGHSAPGPRYLPADYAADALAVADHLGWDRMHLVGGSIGGAVAVEIAARAQDRVASIACFGSTLHLGMPEPDVQALLDTVRPIGLAAWFAQNGPGLIGPGSGPGAVECLVAVNEGRDLAVVEGATLGSFHAADSRPAAAALRRPLMPVLVAVGSADPTCPPAMAAVLAEHLDTTAVELPGIGHLPMLEAPGQVVALLEQVQGAAS